ncbi:MAG: ATP-dependent DNA helicase RecQ, partial [Shimia sp.]|nr:ATP-dependent DNA helicase RecQ [Shimia sp.]
MAGIGGVGAKKLATYGAAFLEVINGSVEEMHPSRRKIAGRESASLYDQLLEAQSELMRGPEGIDKPMSCSASLLAKVANNRPRNVDDMARLLGERRAERFGHAFLGVLRDAE